MKRFFIATLLFASLLNIKADEGMWLLPYLEKMNINAMTAKGLELSAEQIYSINNNSLKDAIVIFGGGCTGEIVSDQGLIFTNHHCGYDYIQNHSSVEHDYLTDGYWAKTLEDELPTPGLKVTFMRNMEDVTERIEKQLGKDMLEADREKLIDEIIDEMVEEASEGNNYKTFVRSFFNGNQFFLIQYEEYTDVRFVGTPPESIGNFGDDTDNWMWPRHTGDFSVFRVYAATDGSPADYSQDNVPLKPRTHLKISLAGVQEGDYTMIMGFPGSTDRYLSSYGIVETRDIINTNRIKIRGIRQDVMMDAMLKDPAVRIKYATKYSHSSNYWKYSIGQNKGFERLNVLQRKQALETEFETWANATPERKDEYGFVLQAFNEGYTKRANLIHGRQYISESFFRGTDLIALGYDTRILFSKMADTIINDSLVKRTAENLITSAESHFAEYDAILDKAVALALTKNYLEQIPASLRPEYLNQLDAKLKGNWAKYFDKLYATSVLANKDRYLAFLASPDAKLLQKDEGIKLSQAIIAFNDELKKQQAIINENLEKANRYFIKGLMLMYPEKAFYPDANFTMRLTYGTVEPYSPRDAVYYDFRTHLSGVMEKEDSTNYEFIVPKKLKELFETKDFGPYANADGTMPVCFTSTNDITGGNSGSPIMNSRGELIGLAFDGNWEAMSGDIIFENEIQRCINVDIRYVLFVIDKFAGATRLIDELDIVQ